MQIFDAAKFFGYSPKNEKFDRFLSDHYIVERPVFNETPIERITQKNEGISLIFETSSFFKETYGLDAYAKEGDMIFSKIQVYSENRDTRFSRYAGALPFGLTLESTLKETVAILGEPSNSHRSGPLNHAYSWDNIQGYRVGVCFLPEGKSVSFFSLSLKEL
ncbi:hypothetical protein [Massilia sp. CCM 8734]|uniref:hypothetical protein n=1 Tax=Massilia sp. CCM 8734 TaxID=2609283 RepID=UPI001422B3C7|nr:hypothetical protein [Massilia sp. CCM 8734]NIA00580.1 hypothetical protein [Massilia sp. CCM 8734]